MSASLFTPLTGASRSVLDRETSQMTDKKFLVTGATGQIARYLAEQLAVENTVHAIARFSSESARERLENAGVTCIKFDFVNDDLDQLDDDYNYVLHLATTQERGDLDFDNAIEVNAVATGRLMAHFRHVDAFFFSSTCSVYAPDGHAPLKETHPLGDAMRSHCPTYSISKVAAEAVVKFASEQFDIPTVIARMNVAYGRDGGLPLIHLEALRRGKPIYLNPDKPNYFNPVFDQDYFAQVVKMLQVASTPPLVINWCGSQRVSAEEWCQYMAELLGVQANIVYTDQAFPCTPCDTTLIHEKIGKTSTDWRDAMKMLVDSGVGDMRSVS